MAYGLQFTNSSNVVTIDSEFARLMVIASGRYAPTEEGGMASSTYFARPVTSQEPPLVFVRPDTVAGIAGLSGMRLIGSAGNWIGFYVRTYSAATAQPNGRYFVAAFAAQAVAQYGMRLWDGTGKMLFDSGTPSASFTRAFQNWAYVKSDQSDQGLYRNYYSVPFNFPQNEFMLINNFGMTMVSGGNIPRQLYSTWDFTTGTLYAVTVAANNPFNFFLPAVFAKQAV